MPPAQKTARTSDKVLILGAVCLAALSLPLSFTGAAVATPAIARALGGNPVALNWIVNAFMLAFGSSLMAAGTLADEFGRRRVFAIGVGLFSLFSLASALAPNLLLLDFLRAAQGLAAALTLAGGSAALAQEFDGTARTRAFGLLGATFGMGLAFGPILSGFLVQSLGWRSTFLSGTVIGLLALTFGVPRMRESRDPNAKGVDWPGTLSFGGALVLFTFAVLQAPVSGWRSTLVLGLFAGAVLLLLAFIQIELRVRRPMLDLSLFRYPRFVGVQMLPIATCYCYVVLLILLPVRFIGIEGRSEAQAGLIMLALSAPMLLVPLAAPLLVRHLSPRVLSGAGLLLAAAGLAWLGEVPLGSLEVMGPMLTIGFGAAFPWGLMDGLSISVVPANRAGMATGIFNTTRVAGEGIALAMVNALLAILVCAQLGKIAGASDSVAAAAGLRVATGSLSQALALLPQSGSAQQLMEAYSQSFRILTELLAGITSAAALIVLLLLRSLEKPGAQSPHSIAAAAEVPDQAA